MVKVHSKRVKTSELHAKRVEKLHTKRVEKLHSEWVRKTTLETSAGKHVVFGKVLDDESMRIVEKIEAVGSQSGATNKEVRITKSGQLQSKKDL